jgi:hypothetical protein
MHCLWKSTIPNVKKEIALSLSLMGGSFQLFLHPVEDHGYLIKIGFDSGRVAYEYIRKRDMTISLKLLFSWR